jgi:hypothetical protein
MSSPSQVKPPKKRRKPRPMSSFGSQDLTRALDDRDDVAEEDYDIAPKTKSRSDDEEEEDDDDDDEDVEEKSVVVENLGKRVEKRKRQA